VSGGYAYLDGRMVRSLATVNSLQLPVGAPIAVQGQVPALTPRHSAFLWAVKELGEGFSAGGGLSYMAERYASLSNRVVLPAYVVADLMARYDAGAWGVTVNLKNATNRTYYVSAHGSVDNLILPGAPRQLQVTLRARF